MLNSNANVLEAQLTGEPGRKGTCRQYRSFQCKQILGCVSLGKSKSGFLYPKADFAFLYLYPKMD